jgi:hypothetical protein
MCSNCTFGTERYRAKDNVPTAAHLCEECIKHVSITERQHYVDLDDDRCTNCKEFDLDGCPSCGLKTHAKLYGVDEDVKP